MKRILKSNSLSSEPKFPQMRDPAFRRWLKSTAPQGFSTVELLVTLFIAAAFLVSGYQLYSVIIKDGGETRQQAKASNLAYDYLQQTMTKVKKNECPQNYSDYGTINGKELPTKSDEIVGLTNVKVLVKISCFTEQGLNGLTKISVTVTYGNPAKHVVQGTYVNKD